MGNRTRSRFTHTSPGSSLSSARGAPLPFFRAIADGAPARRGSVRSGTSEIARHPGLAAVRRSHVPARSHRGTRRTRRGRRRSCGRAFRRGDGRIRRKLDRRRGLRCDARASGLCRCALGRSRFRDGRGRRSRRRRAHRDDRPTDQETGDEHSRREPRSMRWGGSRRSDRARESGLGRLLDAATECIEQEIARTSEIFFRPLFDERSNLAPRCKGAIVERIGQLFGGREAT